MNRRRGGAAALAMAGAALMWAPEAAQAAEGYWHGGQQPPVPEEIAGPMHDALAEYLRETVQPAMTQFDNRRPWESAGGLTEYIPSRTYDGYTLLSALSPHFVPGEGFYFSILIDMEGQIVNEWRYFGFPAKLLPGGHVLAGGGGGRDRHLEAGSVIQADWCGTPVWSWTIDQDGGVRWHHDIQREGNPVGYYAPGLEPLADGGRTLILGHDDPPMSETWHVSDEYALEEDIIYEVDWDGTILWSWRPFEHFDEMGFDAEAREAIRSIPVGAPESIGGGFTSTDWQHINAISYLGPNVHYQRGDERFHPDNIIWDGRTTNMIAIIARHDHPDGEWQSGDIVWQVGPNYDPGHPESRLGQIIGQHMAHMIPKGLPGAGNILVFDNGGLAGYGPLVPGLPTYWPNEWRFSSRVIEFDPQTLEIVWSYEQPVAALTDDDPKKFFSWFISGAQRLQNGNTLITEGATGRVFEVTEAGEIVWEYISPFGFPGFGNAVYRAYRVPKQWIPNNPRCAAD